MWTQSAALQLDGRRIKPGRRPHSLIARMTDFTFWSLTRVLPVPTVRSCGSAVSCSRSSCHKRRGRARVASQSFI